MKISSAFFSLFFALATFTVRADMVIVQKVEGIDQASEMTMKIKNGKALVNVNPQLSTIYDTATGDTLTLMHAQKIYMRVSAAATKAMLDRLHKTQPSASAPAPGSAKLVDTGKKENVNGVLAEIYTWQSGDVKQTYWLSKDFPNYAAVLEQMMSIQKNSAMSSMTKDVAPEAKDFPGMPLKTVMETNGQKITTTLVSAKEQPVPDSEFQIPAGYTEMTMPNLPAQ